MSEHKEWCLESTALWEESNPELQACTCERRQGERRRGTRNVQPCTPEKRGTDRRKTEGGDETERHMGKATSIPSRDVSVEPSAEPEPIYDEGRMHGARSLPLAGGSAPVEDQATRERRYDAWKKGYDSGFEHGHALALRMDGWGRVEVSDSFGVGPDPVEVPMGLNLAGYERVEVFLPRKQIEPMLNHKAEGRSYRARFNTYMQRIDDSSAILYVKREGDD